MEQQCWCTVLGGYIIRRCPLHEAASKLRDACDEALNVLIACVVPGPGCDDRAAMLSAQQTLRTALAEAEGRARRWRPNDDQSASHY